MTQVWVRMLPAEARACLQDCRTSPRGSVEGCRPNQSLHAALRGTPGLQDFIPRRVRVNGTHCRLALLQATSPSRPLVPTPVNATDDAGWSSDTDNSTLPLEVLAPAA